MGRKLKVEKNVKPGMIKYVNEDTNEIKKFIYILLGVVAIALILYFVTAKFLVKDKFQNEVKDVTETITYDSVIAGTLFNRSESEYYVLCQETKDNIDQSYLNALVDKYLSKSKVYSMDLSLEVNKKYVSTTGNSEASAPSELKLVNPTLIHIKDGKIANYYEGKENIEDALIK